MAKRTKDNTPAKQSARDFIDDAMKRYREAADAESENRSKAIEDLEFWLGTQWTPEARTQRENEGRPCLTMNRVKDMVAKVVNEQRQEKPGIQVDPVGSGADRETAEVLSGLIRHIQERSQADDVYEGAYETAVVSGLAYWRVRSRYCDSDGFNQELCIERIKNRFTVYRDPSTKEPDGSDARFCFVVEDLSKDDYEDRYPDSDLASLNSIGTIGDAPPGWITKEDIRIAEYWHIEETKRTIKSPDGSRTREVCEKTVVCSVINAIEILEEYTFPGEIIPIIPIIVHDVEINGRREIWGLVRPIIDPQRAYNYQVSAATEATALAPKAPFIVAEGQIEGHEHEWNSANQKSWPVLQYKPITATTGQPAPPPQRNSVEPPIQAMMMLENQAADDMKAVSGLYDAQLGNAGPEQSARAIVARQNQGGISTLAYTAALARAIKLTGRILIAAIPYFYDVPRIEHIVNPDGSGNHVALFNSEISGLDQQAAMEELQSDETAIKKIYDVGTGRYNVTVDVGPSYQSKRQEAAVGMLTLINSYPAIVPIAGDLLVRNLDWPGAQELAERLRKMLPQQLQPVNGDPQVIIGQQQQQIQQLSQDNQKLMAQLEAASQTILTKHIEAQSRQQVAELNAQTQLITAEIKAHTQAAQTQAAQEIEMVKEWHRSAHDAAMAATDRIHIPTGGNQNTPGKNP